MILVKQNCKMDVDVEKTSEYYRSLALCDCPCCRNFHAQVGYALPTLKEFLSELGADLCRPDELGFSTEHGMISYHFAAYTVCGRIMELDKSELDINDNGLRLNIDIDNRYVPNSQKDEYFVIWVYGIMLPWVLNEPNPELEEVKNTRADKIMSRYSVHRCVLVKKYRTPFHYVLLLDDHGKRFRVNAGKALYDLRKVGEKLTVGRIGRRLINIRPGHGEDAPKNKK